MKLIKNLIRKSVAVFLLLTIFTGSIVYLKQSEDVSAESYEVKLTLKAINRGTGVEISITNCEWADDIIQIFISGVENDSSKYAYAHGNYYRLIKHFWSNSKNKLTHIIRGLPEGKYTFVVKAYDEDENYCKVSDTIEIKAPKINDNAKEEKLYDFSDAKQGDIIKFGSYEQDGYMLNGKEDIEWIVLSNDNEKLFLLSKYVLDTLAYEGDNGYGVATPWALSPLRAWLNTEFYKNAFSDSEKAMIISTNVDNHAYKKNGMPDTEDTIDNLFLLSVSEINDQQYGFSPIYDLDSGDWFSSEDENGLRKCEMTEYASVMGAASFWWLRSVGDRSSAEYEDGSEDENPFFGVAYVSNSGTINTYGTRDYECSSDDPDYDWGYKFGGVRPAMYISLKPASDSDDSQNEVLEAASKYTIQDTKGRYLSYKKINGVNVLTVSKKKKYWIIEPTNDGRYIISLYKNKKLRIDLDNAWDLEGNMLKLFPNSGYVDAQTWYLDKNSDNTYCIRTSYNSGRLIAYSKSVKRCILSGKKKLSHDWIITGK